MRPEESETPYFDEAFYSSPMARLKYEAPANDAAIKEAYRLVCTTHLDALTTQDRQQISKAVSILDRTVLQISRKLEPEWVTILLTHRMLNPDVSFPWWSTVEPYTTRAGTGNTLETNLPIAEGTSANITDGSRAGEPVGSLSSSPLDRDPVTRYDPSCYLVLIAS